jgi:hypothetical protein
MGKSVGFCNNVGGGAAMGVFVSVWQQGSCCDVRLPLGRRGGLQKGFYLTQVQAGQGFVAMGYFEGFS